MKLYTEEAVKEILKKAWTPSHFGGVLYNERQLLELQTPIELPSDEEIEENSEKGYVKLDGNRILNWINGAKWIKEQILNQNK